MSGLPNFVMVSVPKASHEFEKMSRAVGDHARTHKLVIPALRCGTLDDLMAMSDELEKMEDMVESTCKKIGSILFRLVEEQQHNISWRQVLMVGNALVDDFVKEFSWDEAKYAYKKQSCKDLVSSITKDCAEFEEIFRKQFAQFNDVEQSIQSLQKRQGGSLMLRDLSSLVKPEDLVTSEYLSTLLVVIPKYSEKDWFEQYETIMPTPQPPQPPPIVPRSSRKLAEDNEFCLMTVVVLRLVENEFKQASRQLRFVVRDFELAKDGEGAEVNLRNLKREREDLRSDLIVWCRSTFSDAFSGWIHLRVIRLFVEAVLRYGLPAEFCNAVLLPNKGPEDKGFRNALGGLYKNLGTDAMQGGDMDQTDFIAAGVSDAKLYPYVSLTLDLDMSRGAK
eukprot:CAMPEP_0119133848 /NCGR_PEP_ID=MMETSP1310-20130426/14058_1 /TAXON_ID=464262 /ORGANISM="Genus nov. species nov., Strain RCC2339" /LENGTH=391 /DNA_ID=CAMNT_0007124571 /DNA_START=105 /DNA_END=1280 /DNA_ORIENTATION=-